MAVALAGRPELLLCDEPTSLQDRRQAAWLIGHLQRWRRHTGGSVLMGKYKTSAALAEMQMIDGKDITTEAALSKLMYLLGSGVSSSSFKTIFETSLRGEMM